MSEGSQNHTVQAGWRLDVFTRALWVADGTFRKAMRGVSASVVGLSSVFPRLEGVGFLKSAPAGSWSSRSQQTQGRRGRLLEERERPGGGGFCFFPTEAPGNFGRLPLGYPRERQAAVSLAGWKELGRRSRLPGLDSRVTLLEESCKLLPHQV